MNKGLKTYLIAVIVIAICGRFLNEIPFVKGNSAEWTSINMALNELQDLKQAQMKILEKASETHNSNLIATSVSRIQEIDSLQSNMKQRSIEIQQYLLQLILVFTIIMLVSAIIRNRTSKSTK